MVVVFSLLLLLAAVFFIALLPVILTVLAVRFARSGQRPAALIPGLLMWVGYWLGGLGSWAMIAPRWPMPFWQTLAATVDSETYGHPIEHQAEVILVFVLFAAALSALVSWGTTWVAARVRLHYR